MFFLATIASCTSLRSSDAREPVALADEQGRPVVTVRVSADVLAVGDPRYRPEDKGFSRYSASNDPWKWTDEQRILASALDLRDLLTRVLCGKDADLSYGDALQYDALGDCTGVEIAAWQGDGANSVLVGEPQHFGLRGHGPVGRYERESRRLRTERDRVLLLGAEGAGVELAVWDFAHALGYRAFLPGETWEIVPDHRGRALTAPELDVKHDGAPGFVTRRLTGPLARQEGYELQAWVTRNGFAGSLQMVGVQGHWGHIYQDDRAWYDDHPDSTSSASRPSVRGRAPGVKFCPDFRDEQGQDVASRIYAQWARDKLQISDPKRYDMHVTRDHLPLHHGDNTFWYGCRPEHAGGRTPADRSLRLANRVAEEARQDGTLGEHLVGVMAYREVFPGPLKERADPDVFVYLVGNGYMGVPFEDALAAWKRAGAKHLGLYAYWDANLSELPLDGGPQAPVATAAQLASREQQGLRSLWIEANGGWGPNGLFRWALLRIARDPGLARTDARAAVERELSLLLDSFPEGARAPLRRYLDRLDISDRPFLLSPDLVADLYEALDQARTASAADPGSAARIEDLLVYVRHLELYGRWKAGEGSYDAWVEHAACHDARGMMDYDLLWRGITGQDTPLRQAYREAHGGKDPAQAAGDCAPAFDAWIDGAPARQLGPLAWYPGQEGAYALPRRHPGTADAGPLEGHLHGQPRDTLLWKVWLDKPELSITAACHGVIGIESATPAAHHVTSRLLGTASLQLRRAEDGALVCDSALPPSRQGWDLQFGQRDARITPSMQLPRGSTCKPQPRELSLDTGQDPEAAVSCEGRLRGGQLYELVTKNHRMGLDYGEIVGARGVSRWDSPWVPFEQRRPELGAVSRYFYVPAGLGQVALYTSGGPCKVLRDDQPAHHADLAGAPGYRVLDTQGHDGQIWAMRGCADAWLVNLPPVVAPQKELLMAPCDKVGDPGWAPLDLDGSTCP